MKTRETKTIDNRHDYNQSENEWTPINFQRIPWVKLNQELNLKTAKMKNLMMLPILMLLVCVTSCSDDDTLFGSGNLTTETRAVDSFTKIKSEGIIDLTVTQGPIQSLEITSDDNIIDKVRTVVYNNELHLYLDEHYNYRGISIQANITVANLNSLKNFGIGDVVLNNIDNNSTFSIENEGTGNIEINGIANDLTIRNQGSGNILGFNFIANHCTVYIEGSGNVEVKCSTNLDVEIEGSGNVYYKGTPSINTDITGSGSVISAN
ncbi:head GIN domain-containing protein [Seonamhaeicola aphaedonensis]|uniref:Putative autotransporter adhesin-like protein n=1 Tax=Seonamhaeicola aphaedonensis TaxID=1461338 RepID=A0A3D9HMB1_9FLAO|nr:head GIN domain-containing protein [Seonamhaeicola aphaedonensis]RED50618.1 putative autotransporter adhesin-like protein [Seonamhaeicola aphaedonensis]